MTKERKPFYQVKGITLRAMENVQEKLKCLNYELLFVKKLQQKPVSKDEFTYPAQRNTGLQFNHYIQLIKWILSQIIINFDLSNENQSPLTSKAPLLSSTTTTVTNSTTLPTSLSASSEFQNVDVYDDPNVIAQKLMLVLRELDYNIDFPITKLKQPYGEVATSILNYLTDLALDKKGFQFMEPKYVTAESKNNADDQNQLEEEEGIIVTDDEDTFEDSNDSIELCYEITDFETNNHNHFVSSQSEATHGMILSKIDPIEWKIELERVSPALDIQFDSDDNGHQNTTNTNNSWRRKINLALMENENIVAEIERSHDVFQRLSKESNRSLEMIECKERIINDKFKHITDQYRVICNQKDDFEERRKSSVSSLDEINAEMVTLSKKLNEMKNEVDLKGTMMTDASPLIKIKNTLKEIKAEIREYDLQIGILEHNIVQRRLAKLNKLTKNEAP